MKGKNCKCQGEGQLSKNIHFQTHTISTLTKFANDRIGGDLYETSEMWKMKYLKKMQ